MRTHGWAGNPPSDDDEAIERIIVAAQRCIDRTGDIGIADVARELGVTRQTVYRYFDTTDELISRAASAATMPFVEALTARLARMDAPSGEIIVEAMAATLENVRTDPYLRLLYSPARSGSHTREVTSVRARHLGRSVLERLPIDWTGMGWDADDMDEAAEYMLRMLQSFLVDPGDRTGSELREFLRRWLAPAFEGVVAPLRTA